MPKYGVLSARHDHWLQVQWKGTFVPEGSDSDEAITLYKTDVESVGNRDQIRIRNGCALMQAPERCTAVSIDVYLLPQVKKVIIHKFGLCDAYCFFRQRGATCYLGRDLDKDPFRI